MLKSLQVTFKGQQLVFSSFELMQVIVTLMKELEQKSEKSETSAIHLEPRQSALEPNKFNIMHTPTDWLNLARALEDKEPGKENSGKIGYRVGGRHIVFVNHSDRFAFDYGKYQAMELLLTQKLLENPDVKEIQELPQESEDYAKKSQIALLYIVIGLMTVRMADQKLLTGNTILELKRAEDALLNTAKTKNPEKLGYVYLYEKLAGSFKDGLVDDVAITNQIREVLKGAQELSIFNNLELPVLVAALFISETARNPTSFLSSLFLLDFIESDVRYGKDKKYTWKNILWDPDDIDGNVAGKRNKLLAKYWGGKHPMTHEGSYTREFAGDPWRLTEELIGLPRNVSTQILEDKKVLLGTARKKEAALFIRWLAIKLTTSTFQPKVSQNDGSAGDKHLKTEFIETVIKNLLHQRLSNFENQIAPSKPPAYTAAPQLKPSEAKSPAIIPSDAKPIAAREMPVDLMIFGGSKAMLAKHIDDRCVELERITNHFWQIRNIHTFDIGGGETANIKIYAAKVNDLTMLEIIKDYLKSKLNRRSVYSFTKDNLVIIRGNLRMDELKGIESIPLLTSSTDLQKQMQAPK